MMPSLLFVVASVIGGDPAVPPPPPPRVVTVAPGHIDATPVQASPTRPIHDGHSQEPAGQTVDDAVVIADDGFGFPVETGRSEVGRLGGRYDVSDLAEVCMDKPWLCDDGYSH